MRILFKVSLLFLLFSNFEHTIANNTNRSVTVTGFCYLEGANDHSGTKVSFIELSPSAQTDSTFTFSNGYYSIELQEGVYKVQLSHEGWQQFTFPEDLVFSKDTILNTITLNLGSIKEVFGRQSGVWSSEFEYHVIDDVTIWGGDTLIIEPGTTIKFFGFYELGVNGVLFANGGLNDSIIFTSGLDSVNPGDWKGIDFGSSWEVNCIISFARIEYADIGIQCYTVAPSFLINNTICRNNCGISMGGTSSVIIRENIIRNNTSSGISCCFGSYPAVYKNIIRNNYGNGIYCSIYAIPEIYNNTITNNFGSGIFFLDSSQPDIFNNIISNNTVGVTAESSPISLAYNLFWENSTNTNGSAVPTAFGQIITTNANDDPCDTYYNLFMNPLFVNQSSFNFHLIQDSPCIDAGNPDLVYFDPDSTIADFGAYYFDQSSVGIFEVNTPNIKIFPNPIHEVINYSICGIIGKIELQLLDFYGNEIYAIDIWGTKTGCFGQLKVDLLRNGLYFVRIKTNNFNLVKSVIIL